MNGPLGVAREGAVATLTLDRPTALNAFDRSLVQELRRTIGTLADDDRVRAVVITGTGRAFCAGQDLRELTDASDGGTPVDLGELLRVGFHPLLAAIRTLPKPVIAAVNGIAAGAGLALACACDIRVATASATFHPAWSKVGLAPDLGAGYLLPRLIGQGRALELLASGRVVDAAEALTIGLVSYVWPDAGFIDAWTAYARDLAAAATFALGLTKAQLDASWGSGLGDFLDLEAETQGRAAESDDHREGIAAFVERRAPRFRGR